MGQKFFRGDLVRIADKLPPEMTPHFPAGRLAHIVGSFQERCGGRNVQDYTLNVKGVGEISWYPANTLTLVKRRGKCPTCGQHVKGGL